MREKEGRDRTVGDDEVVILSDGSPLLSIHDLDRLTVVNPSGLRHFVDAASSDLERNKNGVAGIGCAASGERILRRGAGWCWMGC